jgi:hypothetical protein
VLCDLSLGRRADSGANLSVYFRFITPGDVSGSLVLPLREGKVGSSLFSGTTVLLVILYRKNVFAEHVVTTVYFVYVE